MRRERRLTRRAARSAVGGGQFLKKTWLSILPRLMNTDGLNEAQLLALRSDKSLTDDAIKLYAQDNARVLRSAGMEDSPGNIYLAHFLGPGGAKRVLRASAEAKVEGLLPAEVIAANRSVLQGKSADQVIAWAHKRVGSTIDRPPARPDAVPTVPPLDSDLPVSYATFKPDQVETDAPLMQYKSGGDAAGVTDALKGVDSWNPVMSQQILVWEGKDGRRVVVDGHQRTGLAKRLFENDPSIDLPAAVVREADGVTAAKARTLGALRNIANGTGTLIDNARVLRDAPEAARMVSPSGSDAQAIVGLSRLSYEAFGAAINRVIDPELAAQIGLHGPDPATHGSMVALLHKSKVTKPSEAAIMVRQAHADGVGTAVEDQMAMFPDTPAQSLYLPIARILEASAKRLRDEKRTFKVLSTKASRIEGAGNVLDRTANQGRIVSSDEALGILNATAHSSGPVRDALIAAARAELSGTRRADAVGGFLDALAGIDLRTAAQGVERHGGAGTAFIGPGHDFAAAEAHANVPDGSGPSLFDDAISAKARVESFSDPVGSAAKEQADLLAHDIGQDVHLFGTEASTGFQMDEHGVATEAAVIMKEATADEAAAAAARACL